MTYINFHSFINIDASKEEMLDKPIYRIFNLEKFLDIFAQNSLTLVKPNLWDDPFENFLLNNVATTDKGERVSFSPIREKLYGQCWTYNKETDFMWRVYAPNKDGIKVKTTIRKLYNEFVAKHHDKKALVFIGNVEYDDWEKIKKYFEALKLTDIFMDTSGQSIVSTLLIKRTEFLPEKEIRIIYWSNWFSAEGSKIVHMSVDPNKLFEEVTVDPRIDKIRFESIKKIITKVGYTGQINHSELYSIPYLTLKM